MFKHIATLGNKIRRFETDSYNTIIRIMFLNVWNYIKNIIFLVTPSKSTSTGTTDEIYGISLNYFLFQNIDFIYV